MSRITKLELAKQNEELRLRLAVADGNVVAYRSHGEKLEAEVRKLKARIAELEAHPSRRTVPSVQAKPLTPWREAAQKARALAMSTGRSVLVG